MRGGLRGPAFPALLALLAPLLGGLPVRADELVVASAVSLREPVSEIGAAFEAAHPGVRVRLTFGASSVLAAQLRAGAPIDVLLSADEKIVDRLTAEGLVPEDGRSTLTGNRLVVIEPGDAARRIERPEDLTRDEIRRIAIPEYAVPVGRYAREWLERRGLLEALLPRVVATEHARATLAAVDYGHADAAIVYATDARVARSARVAFEVPPDEQPRIVYTAARAADTRRVELAGAFLAFLRGEVARRELLRAGFGDRRTGRVNW